jgi:hypothetical protein
MPHERGFIACAPIRILKSALADPNARLMLVRQPTPIVSRIPPNLLTLMCLIQPRDVRRRNA